MGIAGHVRRAVAGAGLLLVGLAAILAVWGGRAEAAPRDSLLCPPPPILSGVINAIPIPITGATCLLGAADIEIVTTYRRPDGSQVTKRFRTLVEIPTLVNVDDDLLPDVTVLAQVLSTKNFRVTIDRAPLELATLPLSVDLIINDPTGGALPRDRIHGGYDSLASAAPNKFKTDINLGSQPNGDTKVNLVTTTTAHTAGQSLALMGGLFDGDAIARQNPLGGAGRYSPMPVGSSITLSMGKQYKIEMTTSAPTTLDASVELVDASTATEQRGTAHVDKLPTSVVVDYIPGADDSHRTVTYSASAVVGALDATYRQTEAGAQTLGAVVHATNVPTSLTVMQTGPKAGSIDTNSSGAFGTLEVGMANGEPVLSTGSTGPYVKMFSAGPKLPDGSWAFNSVAARIDGLEKATVDATGPITADVLVTPAGRKPVKLYVDNPELSVNGTVTKLPEHLVLGVDLTGPVISYKGTAGDNGNIGQGLDAIKIDASQTTPFFGRATQIHATAKQMQPEFVFKLERFQTQPIAISKGIEVTSSKPIGTVEFEATDGAGNAGDALPAPYQDNGTTYNTGAVYVDTPGRFAIGARIHDFERLRFERRFDNTITLGTTTAAERLSLHMELDDPAEDDDALTADGLVKVLPHNLDLTFRGPTEAFPGIVDFDANAGIDEATVTIDTEKPFTDRPGTTADPHIAEFRATDIAAHVSAVVTATSEGASVVLDHSIGMVEATITDHDTAPIGNFGDASGIAMKVTNAEFVAFGRLRNVQELSYQADPLSVHVLTTATQQFFVDISLNNPNDSLPLGHIEGQIAQLPTDLYITKDDLGLNWDANSRIDGPNAVTLTAQNLPSDDSGAPNDGSLHYLNLRVDGLPSHFRLDAGGAASGLQATGGDLVFDRVFVRFSDRAGSVSGGDPDAASNEVHYESADATGFVAWIRLLQLSRAIYTDASLASLTDQTIDVAFAVADPAAVTVDVSTPSLGFHTQIDEPPSTMFVNVHADGSENKLTYRADDGSTVPEMPVQFSIPGVIGADLIFSDIPPSLDFCFAPAAPHFTNGKCDQQTPNDIPAQTSPIGTYRIPNVFIAAIRTAGNGSTPLHVNGGLCLDPPSDVDGTWVPNCVWENNLKIFAIANSPNTVAFRSVGLRDFRVEMYAGDSEEKIADLQTYQFGEATFTEQKPLEDDLSALYLDTTDAQGNVHEFSTGEKGIEFVATNACKSDWLAQVTAQFGIVDDGTITGHPVTREELEEHLPPGCDINDVIRHGADGDTDYFNADDKTDVWFESKGNDDGEHHLKARNFLTIHDGISEIVPDVDDPQGRLLDPANHWLDCGDAVTIHAGGIDITDLGAICPSSPEPDPGPETPWWLYDNMP